MIDKRRKKKQIDQMFQIFSVQVHDQYNYHD